MRHRVTVKKFNKTSAHRIAMFNNMLTSLMKKEKVETTKEKGRVLKQLADSLIHKAKTDSVHSRRVVNKYIKEPVVLKKLFDDIAKRYTDRNGGYTRKLLTYKRLGDNSDMCIVMLLEADTVSTPATAEKSKTSTKKIKK